MAEWLRRLTRNQLCSARVGSNPTGAVWPARRHSQTRLVRIGVITLVWRSWLARVTYDHEVEGSSPSSSSLLLRRNHVDNLDEEPLLQLGPNTAAARACGRRAEDFAIELVETRFILVTERRRQEDIK